MTSKGDVYHLDALDPSVSEGQIQPLGNISGNV